MTEQSAAKLAELASIHLRPAAGARFAVFRTRREWDTNLYVAEIASETKGRFEGYEVWRTDDGTFTRYPNVNHMDGTGSRDYWSGRAPNHLDLGRVDKSRVAVVTAGAEQAFAIVDLWAETCVKTAERIAERTATLEATRREVEKELYRVSGPLKEQIAATIRQIEDIRSAESALSATEFCAQVEKMTAERAE